MRGDIIGSIGKGGIVAVNAEDACAEHVVVAARNRLLVGCDVIAGGQPRHDVIGGDAVGLALHEQAGSQSKAIGRGRRHAQFVAKFRVIVVPMIDLARIEIGAGRREHAVIIGVGTVLVVYAVV